MPPPTRVRKVILRVSKKSTPDAPAPAPVPVPLPASTLEVLRPPQTHPLPPVQPPNLLPSNIGFPIPNYSQHDVGAPGNILPTYAPPHGGMFYPPVPVYRHQPPFPPYGGINAIQPWSYTHYTPEQVAEVNRRFPVPPLATKRATTGNRDSHGHEACGRVTNGPAEQDLGGRERTRVRGARVNVAAAEEEEDAEEEERFYPNEVVSRGGKSHSRLCAVNGLLIA
jgi:hypothetical protein